MFSPSLRRAFWLAATLVVGLGSGAQAKTTDWVGDARVAVRLVTGSDSVGNPSIEAGLEFRYAAGWHGYWRTPGDAGIAPVIDWSGSQNLRTTSLAWPAPTRLVVSGLQNSIYEGHFILPVRLGLAEPHTASRVAVSVDYAACANVCVPEHADLSLTLPAGNGEPSTEAQAIANAREAVPGSFSSAGLELVRSAAQAAGSRTTLVVVLHSLTTPFRHPDLFVEGAGAGLPPAPTVQLTGDALTATLTEPLPGDHPPNAPLTLTLVDGTRSAELPGAALPSLAPADYGAGGLIAMLASALLGGLILNLMPCVLPILSIKLFGLARNAGAERRAVRLSLVAIAVGIIASFLALATVLVCLKLSGATLGWGIQFQQPWFLAGMAVLTVLFAASFFEWLTIGVPSAFVHLSGATSRFALVEAFLSGVLSTLLATPCSAPFVGTAVGFALTESPLVIWAVFLCLGLGMALPYLAAALFPWLVAGLPRPGPWMGRLRQILGLLLLGTATWLLWVLWRVASPAASGAVALILATLLGFWGWTSRRRQIDERSWPKIVTAALAVAALAAAYVPTGSGPATEPDANDWRAFDPDAIDRIVAEGKTVLVDVTASWCLTCKVNELTVLDRAEVRNQLNRPGTVRMRADWSRPSPTIAAYLKHFGRPGIPLDVIYGPRRPMGEVLPELLTVATVRDSLDQAAALPAMVERSAP